MTYNVVMSSQWFKDLSKSVKEAGKIRRGTKKPARVFTHDAIDIRKLRESDELTRWIKAIDESLVQRR
jgi:hypothetical protein